MADSSRTLEPSSALARRRFARRPRIGARPAVADARPRRGSDPWCGAPHQASLPRHGSISAGLVGRRRSRLARRRLRDPRGHTPLDQGIVAGSGARVGGALHGRASCRRDDPVGECGRPASTGSCRGPVGPSAVRGGLPLRALPLGFPSRGGSPPLEGRTAAQRRPSGRSTHHARRARAAPSRLERSRRNAWPHVCSRSAASDASTRRGWIWRSSAARIPAPPISTGLEDSAASTCPEGCRGPAARRGRFS